MFRHMVVGSNDLERSRRFYDALFGVVGAAPGAVDAKGRLLYLHKGGRFIVGAPIDGAAATPGNGATIGFAMDDPAQIDAWHAAGVAAGGTAVEDPPGPRQATSGTLYLAYLRDPDGNKLCAACLGEG